MNPVSQLQEILQKVHLPLPEYTYENINLCFVCTIKFKYDNKDYTIKTDLDKSFPSKITAKMHVAELALKMLEDPNNSPKDLNFTPRGPMQVTHKKEEVQRPEKPEDNGTKTVKPKMQLRSLSLPYLREKSFKAIVLVDLENIPQAGQLDYPADVYVIFVLSHNHAYYCSPAGNFLNALPETRCVEVVRSSLKDATDHYISFLLGYLIASLGDNISNELMIVSRDNAGACSAFCGTMLLPHKKVKHITSIHDINF